jgi:hypothetical protein
MKLKARLEAGNLCCEIELEFTSCTTQGEHGFMMIKPYRETRQRFWWRPHTGTTHLEALGEAIAFVVANNKAKWWKPTDESLANA